MFLGEWPNIKKKLGVPRGVRERGSNLASSPDIIYVYGIFFVSHTPKSGKEGSRVKKNHFPSPQKRVF